MSGKIHWQIWWIGIVEKCLHFSIAYPKFYKTIKFGKIWRQITTTSESTVIYAILYPFSTAWLRWRMILVAASSWPVFLIELIWGNIILFRGHKNVWRLLSFFNKLISEKRKRSSLFSLTLKKLSQSFLFGIGIFLNHPPFRQCFILFWFFKLSSLY